MASVGNSQSGRVLQGTGVTSPPQYSEAAYPVSSGAVGNVIRSDGTNFVSAAPAASSISITGNTGGALTGSAFNIVTANSTPRFVGSGSTFTLDFNLSNLCLGTTLPSLTSGASSTSMGFDALKALTSGQQNTCIGSTSGRALADGTLNTFVGSQSGQGMVSGFQNVGVGLGALGGTAETNGCTAVGYTALASCTGNGQNTAIGMLCMSNGTSSQASTGVGFQCLESLAGGLANTAVGTLAGNDLASGEYNAFFGYGAAQTATGNYNTCVGGNVWGAAGAGTATGVNNVFLGTSAGYVVQSGSNNVFAGYNAGNAVTTGSNNVLIGSSVASAYTSSESSNIIIGNAGVVAESNVVRIGTQGSGTGQQNLCYIAGITGVTVTGAAVLCATDGKLGTVVSSIRYKNNVKPIEDESILELTPVSFTYKSDSTNTLQYGLIAEEVDVDFPYLCLYDKEGKPESVKYHELPTLLLKEIQRLHERIKLLENK